MMLIFVYGNYGNFRLSVIIVPGGHRLPQVIHQDNAHFRYQSLVVAYVVQNAAVPCNNHRLHSIAR